MEKADKSGNRSGYLHAQSPEALWSGPLEWGLRNTALPLIAAKGRIRAMVWGLLTFLLVYGALGACPLGQPSYLPLTSVDRAIPLLPWTLLIYASDYPFLLWILLSLKNPEDFSTAYYRIIAGTIMSFSVFLIFPTVYPRPSIPMEPFWSDVFLYLHFLDQPTNCFPSLHVSITLIGAASLHPWKRWVRVSGYLWAIAICLSTLTTKQHYALDVIGGMFVAMASIWLTSRLGLRGKI
ncbi:phosphatase PAP2 family protein [Oligoflexus tunisiensis]|uniref:phosphatase PAP2 family protein n=1 Tax=Oligoflexus tunisiensis TaxID=708132 RepID=UPI001C4050D0|nr:phosphatase PAP2 family protein [Oligoflexus tunisiensis]